MAPSARPEIVVDRDAVIAFRLRTNGLVERAPLRAKAVRAAAWAGCQDSMPRAAILSLHARLAGVESSVLRRPDLAQVWGPGFSAYVVPTEDTAIFTSNRSAPLTRPMTELSAVSSFILSFSPLLTY